MSCEPPAVCGSGGGRVNAIKSQFENMNDLVLPAAFQKKNFQRSTTSFELLKRDGNSNNNSCSRNGKESFQVNEGTNMPFCKKQIESTTKKTNFLSQNFLKSKLSSALSVPSSSSESASLSSRLESKLSRHTSDPVKRSSIKRSPAFRVGAGDKPNKALLGRHFCENSTTAVTATTIDNANNSMSSNSSSSNNNKLNPKPKLKPTNLTSFLIRKCGGDLDRLQQPGMTDSIRAALRRPLPSGPPPKKPPRSFQASGNSSCPDDDDNNSTSSTSIIPPAPALPNTLPPKSSTAFNGGDISDKINFLENNLLFKNGRNNGLINNSDKKPKSQQLQLNLQKSKTDLQLLVNTTSSFLNCLKCHKNSNVSKNIYDCVATINNDDNFQSSSSSSLSEVIEAAPVAVPALENDQINSSAVAAVKHFTSNLRPMSTGNEPIYMEPFSHLKSRWKCDQEKQLPNIDTASNVTTANSNGMTTATHIKSTARCSKIDEEGSLNESTSISSNDSCNNIIKSGSPLCKCPELHTESCGNDLHYLCTAIGDDSVEDFESTNDGQLSLDKTYDEITILVDAAFQQKSRSKTKNTNSSLSASDSNTMGNRSSDGSDGKSSVRLSRTLTEKRKDYVRRIAFMPQHQIDADDHQQHHEFQKKYATLHRTFKSPVIKTFSLEEEEVKDGGKGGGGGGEDKNIDTCTSGKLILRPDPSDDKKNYDSDCSSSSSSRSTSTTTSGNSSCKSISDDMVDNNVIPTTSDRIEKYKKMIENKNTVNKNINNNSTSTNANANNGLSNNVRIRSKRFTIARCSAAQNYQQQKDQQVKQKQELQKKFEDEEQYNADIDISEHTANDAAAAATAAGSHLPKLFQVCLLVGYNMNTNSAYLKSKYPANEPIPDQIEQLVFPSRELVRSGKDNQDYCLILTDDHAFKIYGYCRRVLPENSDISLPLCYCVISVTKALGFYQKLLQEIESRHGQTESQMNFLFRNLQKAVIPSAGKFLHIKLPLFIHPNTYLQSNSKVSPKRLSLDANPKWLTENSSVTTLGAYNTPDSHNQLLSVDGCSTTGGGGKRGKSLMQEFKEKKQQKKLEQQQQQSTSNANHQFDYLINRSLIMRDPRYDEIFIRRPSDLRLENTELSELLKCLGPELLIDVFSNLLLERKVILHSRNISLLSKSVLALQTILYPFQWQYTIVTILPQNLVEICQAPFPVLAGVLEQIPFEIEDGTVVDLDAKRITQTCGDEQTIIPESLRKSLQLSLEMVDLIDKGKILSSVLISEAFLRFFIELFGDYRQKYFHKEEFIQVHKSQNIKFFLEWFLETSMFRNFVQNRFVDSSNVCTQQQNDDNDEAIESLNNLHKDFYNLFDARLMERSKNSSKTIQNIETIVKNSKIINKNKKSLKNRLKALFD